MSWVFVIWELVGIFKCFIWPCLFSLSWLFFLLLFWLYINCAVSALNFEKLWFYMKYIFSALTGIYGHFEFWSILSLQLYMYPLIVLCLLDLYLIQCHRFFDVMLLALFIWYLERLYAGALP